MGSPSRLLVALVACAIALVVGRSSRADDPRGRALPSPIDATNTCLACHATLSDSKLSAPAREHARAVHRDDRIGCAGCHGGDARDPTVNAHAAKGFRPHPTHAEVAGICGGCHSDAAFIRRLDGRLPVGQKELFDLSLHGRLSAAGDSAAPNCASCHGKHDIAPPASPLAPVNRANVARLCAGCHADSARMAKYEIRTDQFAKWEKSVHGRAFAAGNERAPTCTGCHGAHASTPPDASSVARACGRCHEEEMGFFEQSPHSRGFRQRGLAQCVVCHGNHDVQPATATMVGTGDGATCMKCHANDDKPRKVAEQIADLLRGARERAASARAAVDRAHAAGLRVAGARFALDRVATAETKVRGVVHTLDPARVASFTGEIDRAVADAERLVQDAERARAVERRGYLVALAFALLLLASLALKAMQIDRRRSRETS